VFAIITGVNSFNVMEVDVQNSTPAYIIEQTFS